jgi:formylglycine-generating enzyme required for sulfatase activity
VAAIIKLIDIDEAITNLHYKNKDTLKYKLIHTIRLYYEDEGSAESLQHIDTKELVEALWFAGDDPELIKSKKKNLSSVKSSINADLKRLYKEGKNPQGVIIGQNNIFDMSDEAKDKALGTIADVLREKGTDTIAKIAEVLKAVNEVLSDSGSSLNMQGGSETIDRMKGLILDLSREIGFSIPGDSGPEHTGVSESAMSGNSVGQSRATRVTGYAREEKINEVATGGTYTSRVVDDRTQGQELLDEIDLTVKDDGVNNTVDEAGIDVSEELTDEIVDGVEADVSGEIIEETVDEVEADLSEQVVDEIEEEALIEEINQGIEDEIIDEIVDQTKADGAAQTIDEIAEDGSIDKTGPGIGGTEGEGGLREVDAVGEIQDYQQEGEIADKTDSVEVLKEDDAIDEVIAVVSDELPANEPPVEGDLEEMRTDSALEEVESQEMLQEESASDEILEDRPFGEADLEAEDHLDEVESEEVFEEKEEIVDEVVVEDLRQKVELLAKLAEAARVLEKLGPDLSESIYSEKEIKEKAKLLSEEFDRDLSVRERFYNQHILIKGGHYITGSKNIAKNELPEERVHLRDFYIGKFPVTNALFEVFVDKTGYQTTAERQGYGFVYTPRSQRTKNVMTGTEEFIWNKHLQYKKVQGAFWYQPNGPNSSLYNKRRHPVVQVSMDDAHAFAAWTGKRIPTENEWEAAARTSHGYVYPWGNQWKDNACNIEKSYFGETTPVDKYLEFAGESGVADTLGNVLEWTLDIWESPESGEKNIDIYVVKGGSWISNSLISLFGRYPMDRNTSSNIQGFRCVVI